MKFPARAVLYLLALFLVLQTPNAIAEDDPALLTLERIYAQEDFKTTTPVTRWLEDEGAFVTLENSTTSEGGKDIVRHDAATGQTETLVAAEELIPASESKPLEVEDFTWSRDKSLLLVYTNSQRVWRQKTRGDYWLLDRPNKVLRKVGENAPEASLMFAKLSPDGTMIAYVRERNIYAEEVRTGKVRKLTDTSSDNIINGTFDWVYEEELSLRDGFRWGPDSKSIAYWQLDTSGVGLFPLVNNTDSLYPKVTWFGYPKVGEQNSASRIGVVNVGSGKTRWMDLEGDPRNQYIARMDWAENSDELVLQVLNRAQNANRVLLADVKTGKTRTLLIERDDAWVDIHDELKWLDDGRRFTWISERDGWRHAYLGDRDGSELQLLTPGDFDVAELLAADAESGWAYFIASPGDATRRYLYRVRLDGSGLERVTPADAKGWHSYEISFDGRRAMHTFSRRDSPPITELVSLPDHRTIRIIEESKAVREKTEALHIAPTEFFQVDIGDGIELDAWMVKPPDFDPAQRYPLLVFVYGEPAGQTVVDRWMPQLHLWHQMLSQQGYFVMSVDNRGTAAPRGRGWRKVVYRQIGVLAPKEQAAAVGKVLEERPYLDPERVGVWGASGGGSMTLNAMFKHPELYKAGIAVAPVPDQLYYDTIYQERYMGLPKDNEEGFREGSPINFAGQLQGDLLLIHGTGDDNVHYQGSERLINELIRLNKPFEMMSYPNRTHAIRGGENTVLHLRSLMTRFLMEHLTPNSERP
jgi:dipeptidyl-peptidase-4